MEPPFIKTAEQSMNTAVNKAIENPLEAVRTVDSILSLVVKVSPTLPWETPIPIPRALYDQMKEMGGK